MGRLKIAMVIGCWLLATGVFGQSQDKMMARRYFERTFYSEAIPIYERLVETDGSLEVIRNLADAYYFTGDFAKSQPLYRQLLWKFPDAVDASYTWRYIHTLKTGGDYKLAADVYRKFLTKTGQTDALQRLEKDIETLDNITAIGPRFDIRDLPFNTPFSEFGGSQDGKKVVFAGVKRSSGLLDKKFKWNDERYLDLLAVTSPDDSVATSYAKELETDLHEASAVFTKDGRTMYFTRNYFKDGKRGKNGKRVSVVQLYKAEYDGGWTRVTALPFNSPDFSVEHPALSPDEKTLYFASDRPGGIGSFDIWSVAIHNGTYSEPVNLGSEINTDQREQFPFVAQDGKLYFASDGHYGYGALDVYVSDGKTVYNVGLPLNSGYDDFAFSIDPATRDGYFSSNRPGGKGSDDIYFLHETKPLIVEGCKQEITGIISDKDTQLPLEGAKVVLETVGGTAPEEVVTTAADGAFRFRVACEATYKVSASKPTYSSDSRTLKLKKERGKVNDASMALKSDAAVEQERKQAEEAARKAAEQEKRQRVADIKAKEKDVVEERGRLVIKTDPIYFDYDLWYIRKDSKPILDRVVELMKKYPEMVVEIGSHTDVRGTYRYNEELSSKRAASTLDYIIEHGIPATRISAKGYGESQPIIRCVPDDACNEEQHELNRRSEFVIKNL
ncbi:MAG TPA: OmpA family protein [Flavobacterium sp.]|nr:OmpA family protein [Flavobacterium sp.]